MAKKLTADAIQEILGELGLDGDEAAEAALRKLTRGVLDGRIMDEAYSLKSDYAAEAILQGGSDSHYTGGAYDWAYEKLCEAFYEENPNISQYDDNDDDIPLNKEQQQLFDKFKDERFEGFAQDAYNEVGIDDNLDDQCLRSAMDAVNEKTFPDCPGLVQHFFGTALMMKMASGKTKTATRMTTAMMTATAMRMTNPLSSLPWTMHNEAKKPVQTATMNRL